MYDEILYPTPAYAETHPDSLARMAVLLGLEPPSVERCRVLELGCGDGGNIIPMSFELPNSEFVGVDLARRPIAAAQRVIEQTGVRNVAVHALDLMDVGSAYGQFDYVIAHGVYAWVPKPVQNKILAICRDQLTANGVAFVSFNTQPGGHIRQAVRDMMHYHLNRPLHDARSVKEGKEFLKLLTSMTEEGTLWNKILCEETTRLDGRADSVVFHDELGPEFSAVYFSEFAADAGAHDLQFLCDTSLGDLIEPVANGGVAKKLDELAQDDYLRYQQYLDFVKFRSFRRSLVCRKELDVDRRHFSEHLRRLYVASPLVQCDQKPDGSVSFKNERGPGTITASSHVIIGTLRALQAAWPRAVRFTDLERSLGGATADMTVEGMQQLLADAVLKLATKRLIDLRSYQPPIAEGIGRKPQATALARLQAGSGSSITTLLHTQITLSDAQTRKLLWLLDGSRDISAVVSALMVQAGGRRNEMEHGIRATLEGLRKSALLLC